MKDSVENFGRKMRALDARGMIAILKYQTSESKNTFGRLFFETNSSAM